jgi:hypothetical protein
MRVPDAFGMFSDVVRDIRESLSTMTWWQRPLALSFLLLCSVFLAFLLFLAVTVLREVLAYLAEHLTVDAVRTALIDALMRLGFALAFLIGWFSGCAITERLCSRKWVAVLGGLIFIALFHLPLWLMSGQTLEFGYSLFWSFFLAFLVYMAFTGARHSATERQPWPTYTELSVREVILLCVKVCAVVAGVAIVFAVWLGSGSYDEDGYMIDAGYEVTPDERFEFGMSTFLFMVIPALSGVWHALRPEREKQAASGEAKGP